MIDENHPLVKAVTSVQQLADEYVSGYEMYGETEEGADCVYSPNERETMLIQDAINGLICDEDFLRACRDEVVERERQRLIDMDCIICGCRLPGHWGACSASTVNASETQSLK